MKKRVINVCMYVCIFKKNGYILLFVLCGFFDGVLKLCN